jgi:hypothetical protein
MTPGGPEAIARIRTRNSIYYVPAVANIKQRHAAHSTSSNYLQDGDYTSDSTTAAQLVHNEVVDRWHCRLVRARRDRVSELMRNGELLTIPYSPNCDNLSTATKPGDVIHSDVAGPLPRSHSGCKYTV